MRHIIPAIVATVQILIGFFFFFTLVMISIHMVSPVIMPDAHVGPTWTLIQCMTPGAVVAGVGVLWGLVMFPAGYVAQYIVAPRVVASWEARARRKAARTARVWSFVKKNTHAPRLLAPLPVIMKGDPCPDCERWALDGVGTCFACLLAEAKPSESRYS